MRQRDQASGMSRAPAFDAASRASAHDCSVARLAPGTSASAGVCCELDSVMSFIGKLALAIVLAAGLSQAIALSQSPLPPTESSLSGNPALVRDWADRLRADDPKSRATAEGVLVQGALRSLPLLRRFLPLSMKTCMW